MQKCHRLEIKVFGESGRKKVIIMTDESEEKPVIARHIHAMFGGRIEAVYQIGEHDIGTDFRHKMVDGQARVPRVDKMVHTMTQIS